MFAEVFNNILHRTRVSQKELAYTAGISESEISKYLSGIKEPKYSQLIKISEAMNIPVSQLFEGSIDKFFSFDPESELLKKNKSSEIQEFKKFLVRPLVYEQDENLFVYKFYTIDNVIGLKFHPDNDFLPPTNIKISKGGITVTKSEKKDSSLHTENDIIIFEKDTSYILDIPSGTSGYIITISTDVKKFRDSFMNSLINEAAA